MLAPPAELIDLAPTVAALLGIPAPGHGLGRTLVELIALDEPAQVRRRAADATRLAATHATVERARAQANALVLEHRTRRIGLVIGGAVVAIAFAILALRRRVMHLDVGVLFTVVPAFFVVYFGLIGTLGQQFSPSLLPANAHMAGQLAKYGIVAVAVQMATGMWALRGKATLSERLAEANGIAWVGLMLTIVPASLLWALFPPPYDEVPGPVLLVMIPAVEVAVAAAAAGVALMLAIELVVFGSRALRPPRP